MDHDFRIRRVHVTHDEILIGLMDGRVLAQPLRAYPKLQNASAEALTRFRLVDGDHGVAWPELHTVPPQGMINVFALLWDKRCESALRDLAAANWQLMDLSPRDRAIVSLWRLEADVNNGGFVQFFCNWGDVTCQFALRALEDIGAHAMLSIVRRMRGILDRLEDDPSIVQLADLYRAMTEAEHQEMSELDHAFWAYPDDLGRLAIRHFCT